LFGHESCVLNFEIYEMPLGNEVLRNKGQDNQILQDRILEHTHLGLLLFKFLFGKRGPRQHLTIVM
jgi:hypothetical protein